jgi:hypothetical protein
MGTLGGGIFVKEKRGVLKPLATLRVGKLQVVLHRFRWIEGGNFFRRRSLG